MTKTNTTTTKRMTKATLKSFINKNASRLFIKNLSSFDSMTDCVQRCENAGFRQAEVVAEKASNQHTLGISGVWLVGQSRDWLSAYAKDGFEGIEVYNSCGNFILAVHN